MVIYEVNISVDKKIYADYHTWLMDHVQEMLNFPGFENADIGVIPSEHSAQQQLRICYTIKSAEDLEHYLQNYAAQMREQAISKFGNQFKATRRIREMA